MKKEVALKFMKENPDYDFSHFKYQTENEKVENIFKEIREFNKRVDRGISFERELLAFYETMQETDNCSRLQERMTSDASSSRFYTTIYSNNALRTEYNAAKKRYNRAINAALKANEADHDDPETESTDEFVSLFKKSMVVTDEENTPKVAPKNEIKESPKNEPMKYVSWVCGYERCATKHSVPCFQGETVVCVKCGKSFTLK